MENDFFQQTPLMNHVLDEWDLEDQLTDYLDPSLLFLEDSGPTVHGDVERISMAVYRMISIHQDAIGDLTRSQMVVCPEKMDGCLTMVDKIAQIKHFFPFLVDAKCHEDDLWVCIRPDNDWFSHQAMFGVAVDIKNTSIYHTGEVHILNNTHPWSRTHMVTVAITHMPPPHCIPLESYVQIDELMFFTDAQSTKSARGMPSHRTLNNTTGQDIFGVKKFMKKTVATFAFTLLYRAMSNHAQSTTLYTAFKLANTNVTVSNDTPTHMWEWILSIFDGIREISSNLALKAWSIFSLAVCTKSSFRVSCNKILLHNAYPSCGVTVDSIDHTLLNIRGSEFVREGWLMSSTTTPPKEFNWKRVMARSFAVSVFVRYDNGIVVTPYRGSVVGAIDIDQVAPFVYLGQDEISACVPEEYTKVQPSKRKRTSNTSCFIPLSGKVTIQHSRIVS